MTRVPVDDARQDSQLHERRLLVWLFLAVAAASLLFQEAAVTVYDGRTVYAVTEAVIERGTFVVDQELVTQVGRGGHHYSSFGLGLSVVAAVPYLLVRPLALRTGYADKILEAAAASVMAFVTAALVVAVSVLARRFGSRRADALLVGVGIVAGTFLLPYTKEFFSEPLTALCIVVAIERLLAGKPGVAGLAMGAAVLVRPQNLLFAPVVGIVALWRGGLPAGVRVGAGLGPGVAATLAYNIARFEHPLEFGYAGLGFTNPVWVGVHGLLFEPTKSVLLFAPGRGGATTCADPPVAIPSPGVRPRHGKPRHNARPDGDVVRLARQLVVGPPPDHPRTGARAGGDRCVDVGWQSASCRAARRGRGPPGRRPRRLLPGADRVHPGPADGGPSHPAGHAVPADCAAGKPFARAPDAADRPDRPLLGGEPLRTPGRWVQLHAVPERLAVSA